MTEVQREKEQFVECQLYPLLDKINHNILYADYVIDKVGEEFVVITFAEPLAERRVRVTGDSLKALTEDVLRRI
ncbi:hypothetical protein [Ruminococcus sp.]|uniref:hypothetical protein n=1 Tax=Ruminococcus sp. TaxID=41978 RepID=UPI00386C1534